MDGRGSELDLTWRSAAVNNNKKQECIHVIEQRPYNTTTDSQKF